MQDAMIHYMRVPFSRTQLSGQAQLRGGSDRSQPGGLVPSALYPCKPGGPNDYVYVFTSRANPEHWTRLLKVIGREDLVGDPRYDTNQARSERAAEVDEIIAAWTRQHTKEEAMRIIGEAGVPAGAVFDTLELMNDPSLAERGIMQTIEHPTTGKVQDAGLAGALRRRAAARQAVAAARPAQCRDPWRLARHRHRRSGGVAR